MGLSRGASADKFDGIRSLWRDSAPRYREKLAQATLLVLTRLGESSSVVDDLEPLELQRLVEDSNGKWLSISILGALPDSFWKPQEGEQILELLGELELSELLDVEKPDVLGDRLESIAVRHPERGGILRLLAAMCRIGYRPTSNQLHLDPDAYEDPRHREAAQLILLSLGRWGEEEAKAMAGEFGRRQERSGETAQSVLEILSHLPPADRARECLLTALYAALPTVDREARQAVMDAMLAQQRQRLSAILALESSTDHQPKPH